MTGIRVLTWNAWGLKFASKLREQRSKAFADALANETEDNVYDIIALQEIWDDADWEYIDRVCENYPYRRRFKSGILTGPGLAILSKIPIEETFLYRFPINGRPSALHRCDWYVGKGVSVTLLKPIGSDLPLAVLNSHMHASYGPGDADYAAHRSSQAWDFSKMVKLLKKAGYAIIQTGDLNSVPGSLQHRLFTLEGGVKDSWELCNTKTYDIPTLSLRDQIDLAGVTCNSQLNTWTEHWPVEEAIRIDYVLVDPSQFKPSNPKVRFTSRLPHPYNCSYSDHFGYSVDLTPIIGKLAAISNDEKALVYQDLLDELNQYRKHVIPFQKSWRKYHYIASIITLILTHTYVVKSGIRNRNKWVAGLTLLAGLTVGFTGSLNALIWRLFVRSEDRALNEVELEVKDSLKALQNQGN